MDDSELVAQFSSITSATPELAQQYLSVSDNNLEQAIALYFESGGVSLESQQEAANRANSNAQPDTADDTSSSGNLQTDEELARSLANEGGGGGDDDQVRERIQPVTERLVQPDMFGGPPGMMGAGGGGGPASMLGNMASRRTNVGIFNQRAPGAFDDPDSDDGDADMDEDGEPDVLRETVGSSNLTPHQSRLASLFRPPFDIMKKVDLETAKNIAHTEKRWIMVNIQDTREFACQQLNRDVWSDSEVKATIKENFVFLQYPEDSQVGEEYKNYYPFQDYPHIAILDPRTGEQVKVFEPVVPKVSEFLQEVHDFLSRFSLDPGHKNPVVDMPRQKKDPDNMTEEEQIEMAVRESLGKKEQPILIDDEDDDMEEDKVAKAYQNRPQNNDSNNNNNDDKSGYQDPTKDPDQLSEEDIFATILPESIEEPAAGPDTTRIQFRLGSGKRVVRRFKLGDTVRTVFSVVKNEISEVEGQYFSLVSERKKLLDLLDDTIESAGLKNSSVMVEVHG